MSVLGANYPFTFADTQMIGMYDDFVLNTPPLSPVTDSMTLGDQVARRKLRISVETISSPARTGFGVWVKRRGNPAESFTMRIGLTNVANTAPTSWTASGANISPSLLSDSCFTFIYFPDIVIPASGSTYAWITVETAQGADPNNHYIFASTYVDPGIGQPVGGFYQYDGTAWATSGTNLFSSGQGSWTEASLREIGQTFYVGRNRRLDSIKLELAKIGDPSGNLRLSVFETRKFDSTVSFWKPDYQIQTYIPLSGETVISYNDREIGISRKLDVSALSDTKAAFDFVFDIAPVLEFGHVYAFVLTYDSIDELDITRNILVAVDMTDSTYPDGSLIGKQYGMDNSSFQMGFGDLVFETYYTDITPLSERLETIGSPPSDCGDLQGWLAGLVNIISSYFPNVIPEAFGGTGEASYDKGDLLYAIEDDNLARLPIPLTPGRVLTVSNTGLPQWGRGGGQVLQEYWNLTTSQIDIGDALAYRNDLPYPSGSVTPVSSYGQDQNFAGVSVDVIPPNSRGMIATHGVVVVRLSGVCSVGDGLFLSNVSRRVKAIPGAVAPMRALQNGSDGQLITAFISGTISEVPTGAISLWTTVAPPAGWLLCDGSIISRSIYAKLFSVLGVSFGAGDGSTTFALPDLRGRVPVGLDNMQTIGGSANRVVNSNADLLGGSGGEEEHVLTIGELATHRHFLGYSEDDGSGSFGPSAPSDFLPNTAARNQDAEYTEYTGSNTPHNNMPPWITLQYIVKYA